MKALLVFLAALIFFAGCGCSKSQHCITVEGNYLGADGKFTYCYDSRSKEYGSLAFKRDDGQESIVITKEEAEIINEKIRNKGDAGAKSAKHPFIELKNHTQMSDK